MNNAIVYSLHIHENNLLKNYSFIQLKSSIQSLRKFNKDIPVKVFISPSNCINEDINIIDLNNVEIIPFNAKADPRLFHQTYALWTSHKWESSFKALQMFGLDNIFYIDTDTLFLKDPAHLFDKYGDTESIYGLPDISDKYTVLFGAKNGGMNDGQFLLSKHTLKYAEELLKERVEYVVRLQEKFKNEQNEDIKINGVQWVSCQYAVSDYLHSIGKPLLWFDKEDIYIVHKIDEFKELSDEYMDGLTLIHYLNYHTVFFAPAAYRVFLESRKVN